MIPYGASDAGVPEQMLYIKYSKDKKTLNKVVKEDIKFQHMERQAAEVINVVTGSKLKYPEGKRDVNMCLVIPKQMREESEIKGAILMCKDLGFSLAETIKRIAEKFQLSESESSEAVNSIGTHIVILHLECSGMLTSLTSIMGQNPDNVTPLVYFALTFS